MLKNQQSSNFKARIRAEKIGSSVVIVNFGSWELTLREAIFSLLIVGAMVGVGFLIAGKIEQSVHAEQLKYRRAVQIDKDPSQFSWALRTDVGDAFIEGHLKTIDPVSHDLLEGKWMKLSASYQKYQMHTRTVTYTSTDSKGRARTKTRVETYWSWDTYETESFSASQAEFLGEKIYLDDIDICGAWRDEKVVKTGHHKRVVFYVLPTDYDGTMFTTIQNKRISKGTPFWVGRDIAEAYKCCIASYSVPIFWVVWIVVTIGAIVGFFVLDNDWLED